MNEALLKIAHDLENEKLMLPDNLVYDVKVESFVMDDKEFVGKLLMLSAKYVCEIEKQKEQMRELRKQINSLNQTVHYLRINKGFSHNEVMSVKAEKGIKPAKKAVSEQAVKDLKSLGNTDEQICEILGISRSTLWRKRKQWEEAQGNMDSGNSTDICKLRFSWGDSESRQNQYKQPNKNSSVVNPNQRFNF